MKTWRNSALRGNNRSMTVKLTVIYDNPADPELFEKHYTEVHVPLAAKVPNVLRAEMAKVFPKEDGSPTPKYRTADIYFSDYATAVAALATPEAGALLTDAMQLAGGKVEFLLSDIETT
jgi:uncharacterized protein (TIGR02118 family)